MKKFDVLVEISARHVHLCQDDVDILFGKGYQLTHKKDLSQPGQYACNERVEVIGPKGNFPSVIILGPTRPMTQLEISMTDARIIGLNPPLRESGDIVGSAPFKIKGPNGEIEKKEGAIIAKRHIHVDAESAQKYDLKDKQIVSLKVGDANERELVFNQLVVRISPKFKLAVHLDTDEANAAGLTKECTGSIIY